MHQDIHPTPNHIAATAQTLDINDFLDMVGHPNSQELAATPAKFRFQHQKNAKWLPKLCYQQGQTR
jgi:hypothetical protein